MKNRISLLVFTTLVSTLCYADLMDELQEFPARTQEKSKPKKPPAVTSEPLEESPPMNSVPTRPIETKSSDKNQKKVKSSQQSNSPIKFKGKSFSGDREGGLIVLEEDVLVTQDDLRISANKATITLQKSTNNVSQILAEGKVRFYKLDPETKEPVRAMSQEALFDNQSRTVVLKGEPTLIRGNDTVKGKQITYDLNSGWVKATRVEGIVQPPRTDQSKQNTLEPDPTEQRLEN
jgi:lipopolysaccharide export system protein LptA